MTWNFFPWTWWHQARTARKAARPRPKKRRYLPEIEWLETRWMPFSSISLGLLNDTSGTLKITSDGRLTGTITDQGGSVNGKTITFTGGVTGSTTTNSSGVYTFSPTLSGDGSYSSIVASFTDHLSNNVSSSSFTFTYDTTAPAVTLTAPSGVNTGAFAATVSGSDANGLPDGTTVHLDVDTNNDGNFTDAGESNYSTGSLSGGSATIYVSPALANGTYPVRARLNDKAANQGTSASATVVVNTAVATWATTGQQRSTDPEQGTTLPFGDALLSPNTGVLRLVHPLDFDLSSGTAVGRDPAFVYSSDTVSPQPIVEATLASDASGSVPSQLQVQLTWNNGTPQPWVNFSTSGHAAGDTYLLAAQVSSAVSSTGAYPWQLYIRSTFSGTAPIDRVVSGTAYVVVSPSNNPLLVGWSLAGVDQLVAVTGGELWVYGAGGARFFAGSSGTYTSPANDFGTLVKNGDNTFTYTAKDQTVWHFNTSGQQTSVVDTHGLPVTYTYSGSELINVATPDGGLVTLTYGADMHGVQRISSLTESGGRQVSTIRNNNGNLTSLTDPDGALHTFTYANNQLATEQWAPLNATYTYDATTGLLTGVNRGLGSTLSLTPAALQGLTTSPAKSASQAQAVVTDALSQLTTYTLDGLARVTQLQTPDGATQSWARDSAGQPTVYTDPLNRVTSYTYAYGSSKGDLTQVTFPDGSTNQFQYDSTYHKVTQQQDSLSHLTTFTYGGQGDLTKVQNALNQVTTLVWSTGLLQSVTDPLNHTTSFAYDTHRRLQTVTDALGDVTTTTYDSTGNPRTVTDALGHTTTTVFDSRNRLSSTTDAAGGLWTLTYNAIGEVLSSEDPLLRTSNYTYDQRGWPATVVNAYNTQQQQTTTSTYDVLGRALTSVDANNHTTTLTYDPVGRLRTSTNPVGAVATMTYDLAGQQTAFTDGLGHTTSYAYNQRGWRTQVTDPLGDLSTVVYDTEGNVLAQVDARGNRTSMAYDTLNRVVQVTDALSDLSTVVYDAAGNRQTLIDARGNRTTVTYDALNRAVGVTDPLGHTVTTVYDKVGNVVQAVDALGLTTTLAYDSLNRRVSVQDPGGGLATTAYDAVGNVVNTIDQLNNKSTFVYDALNRATQATDPRGGVTTTVYDLVGNVVNVIDLVGNKTTFVLDAADRLIQQTDPLGHSATFAYDLASRRTSATDRDGRVINYTYDNLDRETGETWLVSGSTVNTLTFTYDPNGNLLTAANGAGTYTLVYDVLNRATVTQEPFGMTLTATYDAVGNRTLLQDSLGGVLTSVYDAAERLTSRQFGGSGQTPLRIDLTYTARDQVASLTRYSDLAGTVKVGSTAETYDGVGRASNLQHKDGSNTLLANYTYAYDLGSRVQTETLNGSTTTYTYDTTNELTNDSVNTYTYDLNGNRTMTGYQTGTGNQLTNDGTWTYTYDAEGNLTKKSKGASAETWVYGYDNLNHLTSVTQRQTDGGTLLMQATYVYDAFGDRLEKDVWTQAGGSTTVTRFAYNGDNVWADLNGSNQLQTRRLYLDGVDQVFARISSGGTAAWYLPDHLGSVRDVTDATGAVQDHVNYDGFGNVTSESNVASGDRYKWTGREFDGETGLQYNRWRYYSPQVGRWTSQDPLGFFPGDPDLYRYVLNSATIHTDPRGLMANGNTNIPPPGSRGGPASVMPDEELEKEERTIQAWIDVMQAGATALKPLPGLMMPVFRKYIAEALVRLLKAAAMLESNIASELDRATEWNKAIKKAESEKQRANLLKIKESILIGIGKMIEEQKKMELLAKILTDLILSMIRFGEREMRDFPDVRPAATHPPDVVA